ncbi:WD40 repeat domain-containing protein [Nocardia inohanensis]|uniref:WD40 repeat domain-containing protein n=1 Tax=Nocardia inohanensis TaxID=209246 RepID=UPI0012F9E8C8|nr:tetratricopeptide repeat protein [Nocardia inohanensis]
MAAGLLRAGRVAELEARAADGDRYAARALADWLLRQGRIDEAIDQMRVVAEGGNAGARRRLARLLAGQGRVEEAISQLDRLPERDRFAGVVGWLSSQRRFDLLQQLAVAGNAHATRELERGALKLWRAARLTAAIDLLTGIDQRCSQYRDLDWTMVNIANEWRVRRLHLREEAIELLGAVAHPMLRRVRAGLLLAQGRYDEAVTELRALTAGGDHAAEARLNVVLRRELPALELRAFEHCAGDFRTVAFSPDGAVLAICDGNNHTIVAWHLETRRVLYTVRTSFFIGAIAFSGDGTVLAANGWGRAAVWDAATGKHLRDLGAHIRYDNGVAFISDRTLVEGHTLWDITTGDRLLVLGVDDAEGRAEHLLDERATDASAGGSGDRVRAVALARDGHLLATGTEIGDRTRDRKILVQLWNPNTGEHLRDFRLDGRPPVLSLAVSPDSSLIAAACESKVWLMDVAGDRVRRLGGRGGADAVAFHPDGHLLATARRCGWTDSGVRVWNSATGSRIGELETPARAIAFSPDGASLATADEASGLVCLWDTARWQSR